MPMLTSEYVNDDGTVIIEYSVKSERDGTFDPADITIEGVTIFGVAEPLKNLSQDLRKAIRDYGSEVDFDDEDHKDNWEE